MIRIIFLLVIVVIFSSIRANEQVIDDKPCTYDLARHHIVAYSRVKEFFETADQNVKNRELRRRLVNLYEKLAANANNHKPLNGNDLINLAETNVETEVSPSFYLLGSTYDVRRMASSLIRWMPFNIFKGPAARNRVDDPKNGFEGGAGRIVNAEIPDNLENLQKLYENMKKYIDTDGVDSFKNSITLMENLLVRVPKGYRNFTLSDWELVGIQIKGHTKLCKFRIKNKDER